MDEIEKALSKLSSKERAKFKAIIGKILGGNLKGLDVVKLKNYEGLYRARAGKMRIVFVKRRDGSCAVIKFSKRSDTTYNI